MTATITTTAIAATIEQRALDALSTTTTSTANDNATATPLLERDLEGVIVAAASGDPVAKQLLRTVIYRIALDALIYVDAAKRVTRKVLFVLGNGHEGPGRPLPGRAVAWLENVTRTCAGYDFAKTSRDQWAEWDPPGGEDGP